MNHQFMNIESLITDIFDFIPDRRFGVAFSADMQIHSSFHHILKEFNYESESWNLSMNGISLYYEISDSSN